MNYKLLLAFFVLCAVFWSCKKDSEISIDEQEATEIAAYLDSMGLSSEASLDDSGIYSYPIVLNPGGAAPSSGSVLSFFFSMELLDGTVIDRYDSLDTDTLRVKLGAEAIYPTGVDLALGYLKEGEKWGFVLPSNQAFGDFSYSTLIPENAIIKLEIELLEIQSEEDILNEEAVLIYDYMMTHELEDTVANPLNQPELLANGMLYKRLAAGGALLPAVDSTVRVTYEGRLLNGEVFDRASSPDYLEFVFGQGKIISGFEIAVGRMAVQERALVIMPSSLAYRESAQVVPPFLTQNMVDLEIIPTYASKVGPYKPLIFEIQLIDVN